MRGLEGNMQAQPRVFAHDAVALTAADITAGNTIAETSDRGCCLYVGVAMSTITVTMESGTSTVFKGIAAGSFLPILVTAVTAATPDGGGALADGDIVALF
jgi:hypothetical protein